LTAQTASKQAPSSIIKELWPNLGTMKITSFEYSTSKCSGLQAK